jgi:hypothetical protein
MSVLFGGGKSKISAQTQQLQQMQLQAQQQADADRKRVEKMQQEDANSAAKRSQMGLLSNVLASKDAQKLGN